MAVAVDHAGQHDAAFAIDLEVRPFGALVAAPQYLLDPAIVTDHQPGETVHPASCVNGHAIDVIDKRIGHGRGGESEGKA